MARSRKQFAGLLALFAAFFLSAAAGWAEIDPSTVQKLVAGDGAASDYFGRSVSIDGNTAVIGSVGDDDNGESSGSAYVFVRNGDGMWSQQAKLLPNDGAAGDRFGSSASISGEIIVIGVPSDNNYFGSAYVFIRNGDGIWSQQAKLLSNDGATGDQFGSSVSVDGSTVVIGSMVDSDMSGAAYVFVRNGDGTWSQQAKLLPNDGAAYDQFSRWSVSLSGNTAVVGSSDDEDNGIDSGSAYVFVRNENGSWSQQAKLLPDDGAAGDWFGASVSVSGNTAVIGSSGSDDNGESSGSSYVFVRNTDGSWSQQAKLLPNDGVINDWFGRTVCISGDIIIISSPMDDNSGSSYVFVRNYNDSWSEQAKIVPSNEVFGANFGYEAASISGDSVIIGAYGDDDKGTYSGSAYIYSFASIPPSDIAVTVTAPAGGTIYNHSNQVTINWKTENADFADTMVLSMKRDAASEMAAPDDGSWYRFTENTPNDGSETVTIPSSVVAASDWRFYVRHVSSGKYAASGLVKVAEAENVAKLYLEKSGDGLGTVTATRPPGRPPLPLCGSSCSSQLYRFPAGETIILTAAAENNSLFSGWRGCDSVNGSQCTVAVNNYEEVAAQFSAAENATVELSVLFFEQPYEQGKVVSDPPGINCSDSLGTCRAKFVPGQTVTLTPTAARGAVFEEWRNTWDSTPCSSQSGDACIITVPTSGRLNVRPNFAPDTQQNLNLVIEGNGSGSVTSTSGGINCNSDGTNTACNEILEEGTEVTLNAVANPGSIFLRWDGWYVNPCFKSDDPKCTFPMYWPHTLKAIFSAENLAVDIRSDVDVIDDGYTSYYIDVLNNGIADSGEAVIEIVSSPVGNGEELIWRCVDEYNTGRGTCEKNGNIFTVTVKKDERIKIIVARRYGSDVNTATIGAIVSYSKDANPEDNEKRVELHRDPATLGLRTDVRLQDIRNGSPPLIAPPYNTLVFTHGWQDTDPDGCEGLQGQAMLKCFSKQLWTGMNKEKGLAGGLAGNNFAATAPYVIDRQINTLQYIWAGAFTQTGMTAAGYIQGRRHVFDAGRRLGEMLIEYFGSDYAGKIHFVGHSLGTAVNAYAVRYFLDHNSAAKVQMTILDHPNRVSKIGLLDDMSNDEAKQWGFDQNFFAGVLPELDDPNKKDRLYVDNYFADKATGSDTKINSAGVGTAISGINVYNHLRDSGLNDPNDVGQHLFWGERLFTPWAFPYLYHFNDHSGVHQWYRWTMWPDRTEYLQDNQFVCSDGVWTKPLPLTLLDKSLNPCNTGFAYSILREGWLPKDFPPRNGYETADSPAAQYDLVGGGATQRCSIQEKPLQITCSALEYSSPAQPAAAHSVAAAAIDTASDYAKMTVKLEKDISALSFSYQFADAEPQENVHLLIDGVIVWSMYADAQTGWTQSGKIPVTVKKGEHTLLLAFNKIGDNSSFAVQNMQFFEDQNIGKTLAPVLFLLLHKR